MELNEDNFYIKIIDLNEIYNFLVLSFSFEVIKMLKKLITYLDLRVFSSFHTCSLAALEPKLTEVAWRTRKSWSSGAEDRWIFSEAHRGLRSFIMAHREKSLEIAWAADHPSPLAPLATSRGLREGEKARGGGVGKRRGNRRSTGGCIGKGNTVMLPRIEGLHSAHSTLCEEHAVAVTCGCSL